MTTVDKIVSLFEKSGKSANSILKELNFSPTAFSEWKRGKSKPTTEALVKIANYFDVSIDYLLGRTEVPKPDYVIPPELEKIPIAFYQGLKDLNQEEIDTVNTIVQAFIAKKKK